MRRVLFRIASVLTVLLDLGHTSGYPWSDPAWGVDLHGNRIWRANLEKRNSRSSCARGARAALALYFYFSIAATRFVLRKSRARPITFQL